MLKVMRGLWGWTLVSLCMPLCIGLGAGVGLSGSAWAQTDARTAERLLRVSGLWDQLQSVAPQVRAGMEMAAQQMAAQQGAAEITAAESARIGRAVDAAYAAPRLRATATRVLARDMQTSHVPALVAWYGSANGIAITRLEEAAAGDARNPDELLQAGAQRLAAMPDARRNLLQQIMVSARAVEAAALMTINTAVGVQQGLAAAQAQREGATGRAGPSADELRAALEGQREQLQQGFVAVMLASLALSYEPASDGQLAAYLVFLNSAAGRHFSDVMERVLDLLFLDAATDLGRALPGTREGANT